MKKTILRVLVCSGMLFSLFCGVKVYAEDVLNGDTEIGAEVIKGDLSLIVDKNIDFGKQPLNSTVDFGTQDIKYNVLDYTGKTNGYELTAKLTDIDEKRVLKIDEVEISDTAALVVSKDSNVVGKNEDKVAAKLVYNGITSVQKYTSSIEWNLTKVTAREILE